MTEQAERTEPNEQSEPLSLFGAAERLGIGTDAVRMRIRRGQLRGVKVGRAWHVYLNGVAATAEQPEQVEPNRTERTGEQRRSVRSGEAEIIARQDSEIAYLRAALEREQLASSELRRMLNLEQQTLAAATEQATAQIAAPVDVTERAESPEFRPGGAVVVQDAAAIEKTLKQAGVRGKKTRRKLLDQLRGLVGL